MFGPNVVPHFHHRSKEFKELYKNCVTLFKEKFSLDEENVVIFVTGSATCAIESVIFSLRNKIKVSTKGEFSNRIIQTCNLYDKSSELGELFGVSYETGDSLKNITYDMLFSDCTSSFPYYTPDTDIWVTTTSKQIGSSTGMSVIAVKNENVLNTVFKDTEHSYLSVKKYFDYALECQTPNTPNIDAFINLKDTLCNFKKDAFIKMIDDRRTKLCDVLLEKCYNIKGSGPVLTIEGDLGLDFPLYKNKLGDTQIFLWTGTDEQYNELYKNIKEKI